MTIPLEVPVFSPPSATAAIAAGAHRLELNRAGSYPQGGLTPEPSDLSDVLARHDASTRSSSSSPPPPLRIMIRPRGPPADGGADFLYSSDELEEMRAAVGRFVGSGLMRRAVGDGFVFGVLRWAEGGEGVVVDVERNRELVELARPWPCVFHRAFDDVLGSRGSTPEQALADLSKCGFHGLLTSGGPGSAANNIDTLREVIRAAGPAGLEEIVVGGGVRSTNVPALVEALASAAGSDDEETSPGVKVWFHSSCLTRPGESDVVDLEELERIVDGLGKGGLD